MKHHADIDWLNHELAGVRALNAALPRQFRAQGVAHWPSPPFSPRRLYSVRDLLPALDLALRVIETSAERRRMELADG